MRCRPSYPGLPNRVSSEGHIRFRPPAALHLRHCLGDIPIAAISGQRAAARFDFNGTCLLLAARYAPWQSRRRQRSAT